jgi:hypothetical protein
LPFAFVKSRSLPDADCRLLRNSSRIVPVNPWLL